MHAELEDGGGVAEIDVDVALVLLVDVDGFPVFFLLGELPDLLVVFFAFSFYGGHRFRAVNVPDGLPEVFGDGVGGGLPRLGGEGAGKEEGGEQEDEGGEG